MKNDIIFFFLYKITNFLVSAEMKFYVGSKIGNYNSINVIVVTL